MRMMPYIYRLGDGYKVKRRVPAALQPILAGEFIIKSLGTRNPAVANRRGVPLIIAIDDLFARVRKLIGEVDHETARQIAESWKRRALNQDFDNRLVGERQKHDLSQIESLRQSLHQMNFLPSADLIDEVSECHNLHLQSGSQSWRRLGYQLIKAQINYLQEIDRRDSDPSHMIDFLPELPVAAPQSQPESMRLSEALEHWIKAKGRPERTITEWRTSVRRFIELKGDMDIFLIRKADVRDFRDACKLLPTPLRQADRDLTLPQILKKYHEKDVRRISDPTANKMLTAISSVLRWAVKNTELEENPAEGLKIDIPKTKVRLSFNCEDLSRIFEQSPVYKEQKRPLGGSGEAAYWIPVIALYSGARLEELGQLLLDDVREESGIHYVDLNLEGEGKSLKTEASKRIIPLHPCLIELGFLKYVTRMRRLKHKYLFPQLRHERMECTTAYSKWINRYISKVCGVVDSRKVFHCFRHTFKDACRNAGIPEEIHDALTGHSRPTVGSDYGVGFNLVILHEAIRKVSYKGLEVPPWE